MTTPRRDKQLAHYSLAGLLLAPCLLFATGCTHASEPLSSANSPPRPAGVVLTPRGAIPPVQPEGDAADSLITLAAPSPQALTLQLVRQFFVALVHEDETTLGRLFTADAIHVSGSNRQAQRALELWTRRMQRLDYTDLSPHLIYSPAAVRSIAAAQLEERANQGEKHLSLRPDEQLLIIPIASNLAGGSRFGPVIELALSESAGEYRIRAIREAFEIP